MLTDKNVPSLLVCFLDDNIMKCLYQMYTRRGCVYPFHSHSTLPLFSFLHFIIIFFLFLSFLLFSHFLLSSHYYFFTWECTQVVTLFTFVDFDLHLFTVLNLSGFPSRLHFFHVSSFSLLFFSCFIFFRLFSFSKNH